MMMKLPPTTSHPHPPSGTRDATSLAGHFPVSQSVAALTTSTGELAVLGPGADICRDLGMACRASRVTGKLERLWASQQRRGAALGGEGKACGHCRATPLSPTNETRINFHFHFTVCC